MTGQEKSVDEFLDAIDDHVLAQYTVHQSVNKREINSESRVTYPDRIYSIGSVKPIGTSNRPAVCFDIFWQI